MVSDKPTEPEGKATADGAPPPEGGQHHEGLLTGALGKLYDAAGGTSQERRQLFTELGASMLKTGSLVFGGWGGRLTSMALFGADEVDSKDSALQQGAELGTGLAKGLAMHAGFRWAGAGSTSINPAVLMGVSGIYARGVDSFLSSRNYLDAAGNVDLSGGLSRAFDKTANPGALATDIALSALPYAAMSRLGGARLLAERPLLASMSSSAVFGGVSGGWHEFSREREAGHGYDLSAIAGHSLLFAGANSLAGLPGGMYARSMARAAAGTSAETIAPATASNETIAQAAPRPYGSAAVVTEPPRVRTFEVKEGADLSPVLAGDLNKGVMATVRETRGGASGSEQQLFIKNLTTDKALPQSEVAGADLLATCNPQAIPNMRVPHLFPNHQGPVYMGLGRADNGASKLVFATDMAGLSREIGPQTQVQTRHLGDFRTVSDMLKRPPANVDEVSYYLHDFEGLSKALRGLQMPIERFLGAGGEAIALKMTGPRVLKIAAGPPEEGMGQRQFGTINIAGQDFIARDARIMSEPTPFEMINSANGRPRTYWHYVQEYARSPVPPGYNRMFGVLLSREGQYHYFEPGPQQLGFGFTRQPSLLVIDYSSVSAIEDSWLHSQLGRRPPQRLEH